MRFLIGFILGSIGGWYVKSRFERPSWQQVIDGDKLRSKLAEAEAKIARLEAELAVAASQTTTTDHQAKDDLRQISGIGPAFANRLYEADVNTFADLAALTPKQIRDIIAPQSWQKIQPEAWIEQAKELTNQQP